MRLLAINSHKDEVAAEENSHISSKNNNLTRSSLPKPDAKDF